MSSTEYLLADPQPVGFACPEKCLLRTYPRDDNTFHYNLSNGSSTWSVNSTRSSINLENEKYQLGEKKGRHDLRTFRYRIFYISRRICCLVVIANLIPLLAILESPKERRLEKFAIATSANITASALIRQDHIVNLLFTIACSVPTSAPLWIRRRCAQIHHIGGMDSGLGIAIICWLFIFTILATMQHAATSVLVIAYLNLILLLGIQAFSRPPFRRLLGEIFETTMRFAGWTSLLLFWIKAGLFAASRAGPMVPVSKALVQSPSMWLMVVTTLSIFSTWIEVRKVPVTTYILSPHAIRLDFSSSSPLGKALPGTLVRISTSLLGEWQTFTTIAQPGQEGFSVIVSNPGPWASRLVSNPPTSLYIRGMPTSGFIRVVPLFRSMLLVATGSGLAPLLPLLYAQDYATLRGHDTRGMPKLRIFWSASDPENTFGKDVIDLILRVDPYAVIHDTKSMRRPDMLASSRRLMKESGYEAVGVVGEKSLTDEVVYGFESRGIPAFGAM